jgi:hypothetical protein
MLGKSTVSWPAALGRSGEFAICGFPLVDRTPPESGMGTSGWRSSLATRWATFWLGSRDRTIPHVVTVELFSVGGDINPVITHDSESQRLTDQRGGHIKTPTTENCHVVVLHVIENRDVVAGDVILANSAPGKDDLVRSNRFPRER